MYQGIRLSKVEEDMKVIVAQQELIMNKLSNIERCLSNQYSCFQPPQQQPQPQAITPQHSFRAPPSSTPHHHLELVSPTPVHIQTSTPIQYPQQTSAGPSTSQQLLPSTSSVVPPYIPPTTTSTSQQGALAPPGLPPTTSQLKKVKVSEKALPSGAIQVSLDDINDVIARYPNLKGAKLPTLSMKLAKEAVFGEKIMKQCTPLGSRSLPGLPTAELNNLKEVLFRHSPQYWGNTAEFESVWSDCIESIGQACKRLRTCK